MSRRTALGFLVAGVVLLVLTATALNTAWRDDRTGTVAGGVTAAPAADPVIELIETSQERLTEVPGDWSAWAQLGSAYVEQARITADPTYYDKGEGALQESLALRPDDNDRALTGLGALANARHDFRRAADLAGRALELNPFGASAWGVLTDARHQLGDYAGATAALDRMLELQPGIASFTRASYNAELHGNRDDAAAALEQALAAARAPADEAFCRAYLGALAFSGGDLDGAERHFTAGLAEDPGEATLLLGQARVLAARGRDDAAVAAFRSVVAARPLPEHLVEFGEYLTALGREEEAQEQFALVETIRSLFEASGVQDHLGTALFAADHGDPATAVAAAEAEFAARQNIDAHDALGWALHSSGRDAEALEHARAATSLGGRNPLFLYHRGVIEAALGRTDQARATLTEALDTNPYFSPLHAPRAAQLLAHLGGRP
ncbi:tetratricopeptide repeat protein [Blastococcus mobilis]|uniref:Tetratricopeptide repeat-containing protein n=1 Tax=Blastococcus mobilis TaxID=1938746 RepID=A0A238WL88_9ACTN|nr:tetratricopeptide repeat protein [Blastococcus mobilis]SNR47325.1 Tetratricopeptide repeat-containing protein [Blastococcus mobilis]